MVNEEIAFIYHKYEYFGEIIKKTILADKSITYHDIKIMIEELGESTERVIIIENDTSCIVNIIENIFIIKYEPLIIHLWTLMDVHVLRGILECNIPELKKYDTSALIIYTYLPTSNIEELRVIANRRINKPVNTIWNEMAGEISNRRVIQQDKMQRHRFGNIRAAARLLNGALESGDYDLSDHLIYDRAVSAYEKLVHANAEWENVGEKNKKIHDAISTIEEYKNRNRRYLRSKKESLTLPKELYRILIIDDQIETWKPVWEFIFENKYIQVDISSNGEKIVGQIKQNDYDCVLLDIDLGNGQENGISILQRIKNEQFDLPVIMVTAYDDADISRVCYSHGASFCFVKEREDREDRNSRDYFDMIKKILNVPLYSSKKRKIIRQYLNIEDHLRNPYLNSSYMHLKEALFHYLLNTDDVKAGTYYEDDAERFQLICYNAYRAFNILNENIANERQREALKKYSYYLSKRIFAGSSHRDRKRYNLEQVEELLEVTLSWLEAYINLNNVSKYGILPAKNLDKYELIQQEETLKDNIGHQARAKAGAVRMIQGAYLTNTRTKERISDRKNIQLDSVEDIVSLYDEDSIFLFDSDNNTFKYHCLYIDDDGADSGWLGALSLLLPDTYIKYVKYGKDTKLENILNNLLPGHDFVFLDLQLPEKDDVLSEIVGLELLKEIKKKDSTIPVIILTATDDAYWFRKSLLSGAFDCFPKTNESCFRVDEDSYYMSYFNNFMKLIERLYDYLESGIIDLWKIVAILSNNNFTRAVDKIKIDRNMMINANNAVNESKEEICAALKKALYLHSCEYNCMQDSLIKRFLIDDKDGDNYFIISRRQAFLTAMQAVEYYTRLYAALYLKEAFDITLGALVNPSITERSIWAGHDELRENLVDLWKKRNQAKEGKLTIVDSDLLKKAIMMILEINKAIRKEVKYSKEEEKKKALIRKNISQHSRRKIINEKKEFETEVNAIRQTMLNEDMKTIIFNREKMMIYEEKYYQRLINAKIKTWTTKMLMDDSVSSAIDISNYCHMAVSIIGKKQVEDLTSSLQTSADAQ